MYRAIRARGALVLVCALLFTSAHAQTSSTDLRQWLLDYITWSTDVLNVDTALINTYGSQLARSSETVFFEASALSTDVRLKAMLAYPTAEDLASRYGPLVSNFSPTTENVYLVRAVNTAQQSVNSMRQPLLALGGSGVPAAEWESAFRDFAIYSELSTLWQAMYDLFQR